MTDDTDSADIADTIDADHQVDIEKDLRLRARVGDALRLLRRSKGGMFGAFVLLTLFVLATFAPWIAPHDPLQQTLGDANTPPFWNADGSTDYLIGTDTLGRDILSRIIYGTRVSLGVALGGVGIAITFGMALGLIAGYRGGQDRRHHRRFHQPHPVSALPVVRRVLRIGRRAQPAQRDSHLRLHFDSRVCAGDAW